MNLAITVWAWAGCSLPHWQLRAWSLRRVSQNHRKHYISDQPATHKEPGSSCHLTSHTRLEPASHPRHPSASSARGTLCAHAWGCPCRGWGTPSTIWQHVPGQGTVVFERVKGVLKGKTGWKSLGTCSWPRDCSESRGCHFSDQPSPYCAFPAVSLGIIIFWVSFFVDCFFIQPQWLLHSACVDGACWMCFWCCQTPV